MRQYNIWSLYAGYNRLRKEVMLMNHFINTVILLLLYKYVGLWYKRRQPKRRRYSPSGQDVRFCARPFFLRGVSFQKLHFTSAALSSLFVRAHSLSFILSLRDRKDNGRLTRSIVSLSGYSLSRCPRLEKQRDFSDKNISSSFCKIA